jgi:hypothetical protein
MSSCFCFGVKTSLIKSMVTSGMSFSFVTGPEQCAWELADQPNDSRGLELGEGLSFVGEDLQM